MYLSFSIRILRHGILRSLEEGSDSEREGGEADTDFQLPYIGFLDVISECSSRLISQDKKAV